MSLSFRYYDRVILVSLHNRRNEPQWDISNLEYIMKCFQNVLESFQYENNSVLLCVELNVKGERPSCPPLNYLKMVSNYLKSVQLSNLIQKKLSHTVIRYEGFLFGCVMSILQRLHKFKRPIHDFNVDSKYRTHIRSIVSTYSYIDVYNTCKHQNIKHFRAPKTYEAEYSETRQAQLQN